MWVEEKYIGLIGSRVRNFKQIDSARYQCACPICGDSKKDESAARGSFYIYQGEWWYHCYNCGKSFTIPVFLAMYFKDLHRDYLMDTIGARRSDHVVLSPKKKDRVKKFNKPSIHINDAKSLDELPKNHMARTYVERRHIPAIYLSELLFVANFKAWTNLIVPDKFENVKNDEPRLIIPFRYADGTVFAYQGRSFDPKSYAKYITIKLDPEAPKIYGINLIDPDKPVVIVEGPIDSMFVDNCVADAGSDLKRADAMFHDTIACWDNEPRNVQIVEHMEKAIHAGRKIVIWPSYIKTNDINELVDYMVDNGVAPDEAIRMTNRVIHENTYKGLEAELKFSSWRKD